ncbi:hypothetical protein [Paraglaciecola psychrophila]|uniref:Uncharacterized protein n=1 Tax=Paraglaciecola psychrophila 170 TaxID=1129794 RepID=K7A4P4_9ALTE|nr:hypothetical protein [Paraglaciecola psychrophila]AGH43371.1 hypothetical protein C427_1262 [Paraglaciecola psychrophila 170]GAC35818.1 hypothetical protein GPSY_0176 [Paraglaciecola psychrophila 170]
MSVAWVAYIVVGLAISMLAVLGIGLLSLSGKNTNTKMSEQGTSKDA